ncbi:MAG: tetratricopeptide repeat protein [Thaumarchaeota archaeon]|nr:tetratricopeptide repeat protein [Nitrososphaerota archaeon]
MLGYLLGITLVLITLSPLIFTQVFADSSIENFEESEIILLYTDKKQYTDKDLIKITGLVSTLDSPTVLIGVYDPFGMPTGFYIVSIDSDLKFSTSFPVKSGVNFRTDGTYSIKAHYAETKVTSFFDYYEILQPVIDDTIDNTEDEIKENTHVEEKITESVDKTISDVTNILSDKKIINKEKTNDNSIDDNSIIKDSKKVVPQTEIDEPTNLTVEDIELGKLLNQINLKCDSSIFTDTISYYDGMGPALYRLCKFDSSLNFFNDSLINNPNDVELLVNKGSALGKLGYFSEAIVYYDQAINIDPDFLPAKNNKANALVNLGNSDEAISLYNEILVKNPNYTTARKNLDTALSETAESETKNIVNQQFTLTEKTIYHESEKQKPTNFFEELSLAFSSLASLFGF